MEFFRRADVFRLKCGHHDKYLIANKDEETIKQSSDSKSPMACWAIELVEGKPNVIRLRSCFSWKYLAITDKEFLLGMTGCKLVQRLRLDSTVEWEPIKEGPYVKLKSQAGTFLRANRGAPPWGNSVTHDLPAHWSVKENMILWIVDIVKMVDSQPTSSNSMYADVPTTSLSNEVIDHDQRSASSSCSSPDYGSDSELQTRKSESFSKLKAMLAALEDE